MNKESCHVEAGAVAVRVESCEVVHAFDWFPVMLCCTGLSTTGFYYLLL